MFLLLSGQNLGNHLIRSSLPMLVPFIAQDLGCSAAESALLLGSFFPGCKLDRPRLPRVDALRRHYYIVVVVSPYSSCAIR